MIITLDEAKAYLGVSDSADDTLITAFIEAAAAAMEKECWRHLEAEALTEIIDGPGDYNLWLHEPAESITTVHVDSDRGWGAAYLIDADDYYHESGSQRVQRLESIWIRGTRNCRVVYAGGFATVPADLVQICYTEVAAMYSEMKRAQTGDNILDSQKIEGWAQTFIESHHLRAGSVAVLEPYRPMTEV